ncbi:hypothetical protein I6J77_15310 [Rhodanobacter sp. FDAARGOS 1247]|jgi:poly(3-hydroxybutyrate) depolymerase|uniref:hypothetical protein n=1 Tax=Rhodanobacter sp. FDAARGOS 1247 TaxID=2778082 RepID=UPI00195100C8|nr:hypothetical protein [Rhodanobacter sp. FDAARGOS 1247]QRP63459.1 hypothetical protein I6J77_15310 [Rhodanobacter sp. FDAARGOS 1247]
MTAVGVSASAFAAGEPSHLVGRTLSIDGNTWRYQVFVPDGWTAERNWPVVLFLHGGGGRGGDQVGAGTIIVLKKRSRQGR